MLPDEYMMILCAVCARDLHQSTQKGECPKVVMKFHLGHMHVDAHPGYGMM